MYGNGLFSEIIGVYSLYLTHKVRLGFIFSCQHCYLLLCYNNSMHIFTQLIVFFWIVFIAYWLVSAIGVKKNMRSNSIWYLNAFRIIFIIVFLLLLRVGKVGYFLQGMDNTPA